MKRKIGTVIAASVIDGIAAKLELDNPEELKVGYPVIIEGKNYDFYCIIKDVYSPASELIEKLAGIEKDFSTLVPITEHNPRTIFSKLALRAIQIIDRNTNKIYEPETIPPYLAPVRMAVKEDVEKIYEPTKSSMSIGSLRGVPGFEIQIDFDRLTEKPFGIFGRTGVGKSILCKIICLNILEKNAARIVIFDMHGEYGLYSKTDNTKGLKYFYPGLVETFTLSGDDKDAKPFILDANEIKVEDIIVAFQDLTSAMIDALYAINKKRNKPLLQAIKEASLEDYPEAHATALQALQRRISRIERFGFVKEGHDTFAQILSHIKAGKSIVLDFGQYGKDTMAYLFIANIISRRLYYEYTEKELPRLVLFLEEAHKFLAPEVAEYTIFDRLARETRKFNLILALIDQRPCRINEEVRSQLANRLILSIKEPKDIESALAGVSDKATWQAIVGTLPGRSVVIIGDAVRVPTVIDILDYNKISRTGMDMGAVEEIASKSKELFG